METQFGGFISYLQRRNLDDLNKEKESRRGRKRGLADLSRTNSNGGRSHPISPRSEGQQEANVSKDTGLHRTLSDLTHPIATPGVSHIDHEIEESMRVTWDDTTFAERGILQALNKPSGEGRGDQRRVLAQSGRDQHPIARRSGPTGPLVIDLASDDDNPEKSINAPPSKRRKARLMP